MTTLVRTARQPLQILSMSNTQPERRSKRIAAAYDEADGDFQFSRGPKRARTAPPEPEQAPTPAHLSTPPKKLKSTRGRRNAKDRSPPPAPQDESVVVQKRPRRKPGSPSEDVEPASKPVPTTRRRTRASTDRAADAELAPPKPARRGKRTKEPPKPVPVPENPEPEPEDDEMVMIKGDGARADATPMDVDEAAHVPAPNGHDNEIKIAIPSSDTPIINRNKELRRKGPGSGRRSSLGMRGQRASSLIENGQSALPHREVNAEEFFKHISDGLIETRRMKQLLTWCAERALIEKPALGSSDSNVIWGARVIQDQLLKDFQTRNELSDWFSRDNEPPKPKERPVVVKPHPKNVEHEEKIAELEVRVQRLREEKKKWLSLAKAPPEFPPLFTDQQNQESNQVSSSSVEQESTTVPSKVPRPLPHPDLKELDEEEANLLSEITGPDSASVFRSKAQQRLQSLQQNLEFKVDYFADSVHKLEQRVMTAGRQADRVLSLSQTRLREREEREKRAIGTRELPVMEVLRSLGRILPEGSGG